tara:strand:- start:171 stop:392 length:222 start_codon:yes stop_codon:yes gene_type:complete
MYTRLTLLGERTPGLFDGRTLELAYSISYSDLLQVAGLTPCLNPCDGDDRIESSSTTFSLGRLILSVAKKTLE